MDPIASLIKSLPRFDLRPGYVKEFHDAVRSAVRDGKLTEDEIKTLEERKEELGLDDDVLHAVRRELYLEAFKAVKEGEQVSDEEWDELQHIQEYLGLSDTDITATKKELYRMRILSELPKGNMPIIDGGTLLLKKDELAHWVEPVERVDEVTVKRETAPLPLHILPEQLAKGVGSILGVMNEEDERGWKKKDTGECIITNKRLIFRGEKETEAIALKDIIDTRFYRNGCKIYADERAPVILKYRDPGNRAVIASVLLYAIHHARQGARRSA